MDSCGIEHLPCSEHLHRVAIKGQKQYTLSGIFTIIYRRTSGGRPVGILKRHGLIPAPRYRLKIGRYSPGRGSMAGAWVRDVPRKMTKGRTKQVPRKQTTIV